MNGKEQLVWLRPLDGLIVMTQLSYDGQITKPAALADEVCKTEVVAEELQLLRTLMVTRTPEKFDLARYQDRYTQKLTQLIEAKVAGKEISAAPAITPMQVINLVEALRQSVAQTQKAAHRLKMIEALEAALREYHRRHPLSPAAEKTKQAELAAANEVLARAEAGAKISNGSLGSEAAILTLHQTQGPSIAVALIFSTQ